MAGGSPLAALASQYRNRHPGLNDVFRPAVLVTVSAGQNLDSEVTVLTLSLRKY